MKIKAVIDKLYRETEIHVCNSEMNEQVTDLIRDIDELLNVHITGTDKRGEKCVLNLKDIVCFYTSGQKVLTRDVEGNEYSVNYKLYELEEKLPDTLFLRIAKSEIVNIKKIKRLDMSVTGTIKVVMSDQSETYTSRRNVTRLKQALGI